MSTLVAKVSAPEGPRIRRTLLRVLSASALAAVTVTWFTVTSIAPLALAAFVVLRLARIYETGHRAPVTASIAIVPGALVIGEGLRRRWIRAADVIGATTARTENGILLSLHLRRATRPITLELASDRDVRAARHALGIGHGGFGTVAWPTEVGQSEQLAAIGRYASAASALILLALAALSALLPAGPPWHTIFAPFYDMPSLVIFASTLASLVALGSADSPNITLTAAGVRLRTTGGVVTLPYAAIRDVTVDRASFTFVLEPPHASMSVRRARRIYGGPSDEEAQVIVTQVRAAAQRAHGHGVEKADISGRLEVLRRSGQTVHDWLGRLDLLAQTLASSGYRGATLEPDDLWTILEDPDADAELRTAAARILRGSPAPETRVRIDTALAAVRDESIGRRLRVAIEEDAVDASRELEELHARDRRKRRTQ